MSTPEPLPSDIGFPGGAYRANLYVYGVSGEIEWYAIAPQSFVEGRYFTLGRSPDCNIVVADASVSAHHAYIAAERGELFLRDLGSTNGILVNDQKMHEAALRHGDVLRLGSTDLRFLFSYKEGPVKLTLEFVAGPNAGKSLATFGSSTTLGRLNCAVNLHGHGIAPQHVRIDAYGPGLLYVVSLRRDAETFLNDVPMSGVATARDGDVLRLGEHGIRLRVVEGEATEVPVGQGTLQMADDSGLKGQAPVAQLLISADDMRRLEAAGLAQSGADHTSLEMFPAGDAFSTPPALPPPPRVVSAPAPSGARPTSRAAPQSPVQADRGSGRHPPVAGGRPAAPPVAVKRRLLWPWLVAVPLLMLVGAAIALTLTPVRCTLSLEGEIKPGDEVPVTCPARGRVEKVSAKVGDRVVARDPLMLVVDLDAEADIARLSAQIDALQQQAPVSMMVPGRVSADLVAELSRAEVRLADARAEVVEANAAFNRREATFDAVQQARSKEAEARETVERLRSAAGRAGAARRVEAPRGPALQRLARLMAERDDRERSLYVTVEAPKGGLLIGIGGTAPRVGDTLRKEQPLFLVGDVGRVLAVLKVPPESLGVVEGTGKAIVMPVGFNEPRVPITFSKAGEAAGPDGTFPLAAPLENPAGVFRPGQKVTAELELPPTDALIWLLSGR